jgi:RimJ/RimL family protein N-acetyltransferase
MADSVREEAIVLLETERLRLRRFTPADVDLLTELDSDPEVMRYVTYGLPTPRATYADTILPRWLEIYRVTPQLGYWAAEDRASGGFHGWFHLRPDRIDEGEQELGYRLRRASWGRGYASEGSRALLEHGFRTVRAPRISARTLAANLASRRVMEKCGLSFERDFVYAQDVLAGRSPEERAAVKFSITRAQWLALRA